MFYKEYIPYYKHNTIQVPVPSSFTECERVKDELYDRIAELENKRTTYNSNSIDNAIDVLRDSIRSIENGEDTYLLPTMEDSFRGEKPFTPGNKIGKSDISSIPGFGDFRDRFFALFDIPDSAKSGLGIFAEAGSTEDCVKVMVSQSGSKSSMHSISVEFVFGSGPEWKWLYDLMDAKKIEISRIKGSVILDNYPRSTYKGMPQIISDKLIVMSAPNLKSFDGLVRVANRIIITEKNIEFSRDIFPSLKSYPVQGVLYNVVGRVRGLDNYDWNYIPESFNSKLSALMYDKGGKSAVDTETVRDLKDKMNTARNAFLRNRVESEVRRLTSERDELQAKLHNLPSYSYEDSLRMRKVDSDKLDKWENIVPDDSKEERENIKRELARNKAELRAAKDKLPKFEDTDEYKSLKKSIDISVAEMKKELANAKNSDAAKWNKQSLNKIIKLRPGFFNQIKDSDVEIFYGEDENVCTNQLKAKYGTDYLNSFRIYFICDKPKNEKEVLPVNPVIAFVEGPSATKDDMGNYIHLPNDKGELVARKSGAPMSSQPSVIDNTMGFRRFDSGRNGSMNRGAGYFNWFEHVNGEGVYAFSSKMKTKYENGVIVDSYPVVSYIPEDSEWEDIVSVGERISYDSTVEKKKTMNIDGRLLYSQSVHSITDPFEDFTVNNLVNITSYDPKSIEKKIRQEYAIATNPQKLIYITRDGNKATAAPSSADEYNPLNVKKLPKMYVNNNGFIKPLNDIIKFALEQIDKIDYVATRGKNGTMRFGVYLIKQDNLNKKAGELTKEEAYDIIQTLSLPLRVKKMSEHVLKTYCNTLRSAWNEYLPELEKTVAKKDFVKLSKNIPNRIKAISHKEKNAALTASMQIHLRNAVDFAFENGGIAPQDIEQGFDVDQLKQYRYAKNQNVDSKEYMKYYYMLKKNITHLTEWCILIKQQEYFVEPSKRQIYEDILAKALRSLAVMWYWYTGTPISTNAIDNKLETELRSDFVIGRFLTKFNSRIPDTKTFDSQKVKSKDATERAQYICSILADNLELGTPAVGRRTKMGVEMTNEFANTIKEIDKAISKTVEMKDIKKSVYEIASLANPENIGQSVRMTESVREKYHRNAFLK